MQVLVNTVEVLTMISSVPTGICGCLREWLRLSTWNNATQRSSRLTDRFPSCVSNFGRKSGQKPLDKKKGADRAGLFFSPRTTSPERELPPWERELPFWNVNYAALPWKCVISAERNTTLERRLAPGSATVFTLVNGKFEKVFSNSGFGATYSVTSRAPRRQLLVW
jgi:hypothetical protein